MTPRSRRRCRAFMAPACPAAFPIGMALGDFGAICLLSADIRRAQQTSCMPMISCQSAPESIPAVDAIDDDLLLRVVARRAWRGAEV